MELRQSTNKAVVIGTLKSKTCTRGSKDGVATINLSLVVSSKEGDRIHENKINFWAKENSKLYKGYDTVDKECKTGDKIRIEGSYELNRFTNNEGELVESCKIRGLFINRLDANDTSKEQSGAVIEMIPINITEDTDKQGMPTGRKKVLFYSVGYQNSIHVFKNIIIPTNLAEQFSQLYPIGCTANFVLKINRYAEIEEQQTQSAETSFFGTTLSSMPDTTVKNWVNEVEVIGGEAPKIENKYTNEEIVEMRRLDELAIETIKSTSAIPKTTSTPSTPYFGAVDSIINDSDIPF